MPFDVSGNFSRSHNWQEDRDNGIRILADRHDEEDDNFAGGFNLTFLRTGTVPMTGNLQMGGNAIRTIGTGSDAAPSMTWELSNSTGFSQPSPNAIAFSAGGVRKLLFNDVGLTVLGDTSITGKTVFNGNAEVFNTLYLKSPTHGGRIVFEDLDEAVDRKNWDIIATGGNVYFRAFNDADTVGSAFLYASRGTGAQAVGAERVSLWTRGVERFIVNELGDSYTIGSLYTTGTMFAGVGGVSFDGAAYTFFANMNGASPFIAFDSSDYMTYNRTSNVLYTIIAGATPLQVHPVGITVGGDVSATGNVSAAYLSSSGDIGITGHAYVTGNVSAAYIAVGTDINAAGKMYATSGFKTNGTGGNVSLEPTDSSHTGIVSFLQSNGARIGYIGFINFAAAPYDIMYQNEVGGNHSFAGGIWSNGDVMTATMFKATSVSNCLFGKWSNDVMLGFDANDWFYYDRTGNTLYTSINGVNRMQIQQNETYFNTTTFPLVNNTFQMGATNLAWYNVSSYNYGAPSDAREKVWRGEANLKEIKAARRIVDELGFYKWNHGPAQDKWQFGLRAQELARILMQEGVETTHNLDFPDGFIPEADRPLFKYGMIDFHSWEDQYNDAVLPTNPDDEDAAPVPVLTQAAGSRFSINSDQLAMFLISATAKTVKALEQRIEDLEAVVQP